MKSTGINTIMLNIMLNKKSNANSNLKVDTNLIETQITEIKLKIHEVISEIQLQPEQSIDLLDNYFTCKICLCVPINP